MATINFRDLLKVVEAALYGSDDVDVYEFAKALEQAKPSFINLLHYKVGLDVITINLSAYDLTE